MYNLEITNENIEETDSNRSIIEEAPIEEGNPLIQESDVHETQYNVSSMSFNEYCNRSRENYENKGIKTDDWREHRQFLYISKLIGLPVDKIQIFDVPEYNFKQKEIIVFLLFAKLFDEETLLKEFLSPDVSAEEMLSKITLLLNEKQMANYKQLYEDAANVYTESLNAYIKEKEHFEEQYVNLNESYRNLNAECISYRNENENIKKEYDSLSNQMEELKIKLEEKERAFNDLTAEKSAADELTKNDRIEEENNRKIEERAKEIARDIIAKEEEKRIEKENIEKAAIEKYKQEHNILGSESTISTDDNKNVLQLLAMQQMNMNKVNEEQVAKKKEKKGLFGKKNKNKEETTVKQFYGFDLQTCLVNANLNNAQMQIITYAITHDINENVLVNAINHNCSAEQLKAIVEAQLAQRMKENKKKEMEEMNKHQQEINDYGTYTQEDAKYGE